MNKTQRANLVKLADYLASLPPQYPNFDMSTYAEDAHDVYETPRSIKHNCGTVGCALGHGVDAGIVPEHKTTWRRYTLDYFGIPAASREWYFLFGPLWSTINNTPKGTADRIREFLDNGVPEDFFHQLHHVPARYYAETSNG